MGCPSSGTGLLTSSDPFPKQVWPQTLQLDQPRKPLRLATLVKVIGHGHAGCPHAGFWDGEQSTSTHAGPNPAGEAHSGYKSLRKWCNPLFYLLPQWAHWAEEPHQGSVATRHHFFPWGSPASSAPALYGVVYLLNTCPMR